MPESPEENKKKPEPRIEKTAVPSSAESPDNQTRIMAHLRQLHVKFHQLESKLRKIIKDS